MTGEERALTGEKPAQETGGPRETPKAEPEKKRSALRWLGYAIIVIILILAAAFLTIGVTISEAPAAASYPYTTTYLVIFPASEVVRIGTSEIIAIPTGDHVTLSINKQPSEMGIGETKTIQEQQARISAFGLKIMDFDFKIDATYLGRSGDATQFYLAFKTSRQVPSFLIDRLLPPSVQARPV